MIIIIIITIIATKPILQNSRKMFVNVNPDYINYNALSIDNGNNYYDNNNT